jgi:hypothetical protein
VNKRFEKEKTQLAPVVVDLGDSFGPLRGCETPDESSATTCVVQWGKTTFVHTREIEIYWFSMMADVWLHFRRSEIGQSEGTEGMKTKNSPNDLCGSRLVYNGVYAYRIRICRVSANGNVERLIGLTFSIIFYFLLPEHSVQFRVDGNENCMTFWRVHDEYDIAQVRYNKTCHRTRRTRQFLISPQGTPTGNGRHRETLRASVLVTLSGSWRTREWKIIFN